jgi:uncharacterized protein with PIN domain
MGHCKLKTTFVALFCKRSEEEESFGVSRILKAYRTQFHQLLRQAGARRIDQGVDWLVIKAKRLSAQEKIPFSRALSLTCEHLAHKAGADLLAATARRGPEDISFFCDAGLGGLARWLRAAGYVALWESGIADDLLLTKARQTNSTILTTDSMLMERRLLRDQIIPSFWLPPTMKIHEQLERVFREFHLQVRSPRCMSCGGELVLTNKEDLRERIPPKTFRWLNEYYLCKCCGKLFWHGTHWLKIMQRLKVLESEPRVGGGKTSRRQNLK